MIYILRGIKMNWEQIFGHTETIRQIKEMLATQRLAHAMLFVGPEGIGKGLVARVAAAAMLCELQPAVEHCGQCSACRLLEGGIQPDFLAVRPEGESIKINQIRRLQTEAAFFPQAGDSKVVVVEEAEKMTVDAANSLLKLLEEPPPYLKFILLANNTQAILPTILSRCRQFRFLPLPPEFIAGYLINEGFTAAKAKIAARLSGGTMRQAISLVSGEMDIRDQAVGCLQVIFTQDTEEVFSLAAELEKLGSEKAPVLLKHFTLILRDLIVIASNSDLQLLYNADIAEDVLYEIAGFLSQDKLQEALQEVQQTYKALTGNANLRMAAEALLIRLTDLRRREFSA